MIYSVLGLEAFFWAPGKKSSASIFLRFIKAPEKIRSQVGLEKAARTFIGLAPVQGFQNQRISVFKGALIKNGKELINLK